MTTNLIERVQGFNAKKKLLEIWTSKGDLYQIHNAPQIVRKELTALNKQKGDITAYCNQLLRDYPYQLTLAAMNGVKKPGGVTTYYDQ